jgi:hypothetical protein
MILHRILCFVAFMAIGVLQDGYGQAQQQRSQQQRSPSGLFELSVPGNTESSLARLSPEVLVIQDISGNITRYKRFPKYDTADGTLQGYSSREAQQVIRWPVDNAGRMQIGTLQRGRIEFVWSKMTIAPSTLPDLETNEMVMPEPVMGLQPTQEILPSMTAVHLAAGNVSGRQFLTMQGSNRFGFASQAAGVESAWYITPVSYNIVRLQQRSGANWLAIGIGNGSRRASNGYPVSLLPIQNGVEQLWQIQNMANGGYCFESLMYPGFGLTCIPNRGLSLQPITFDPWQLWWPSAPTFVLPQIQYRTVQQQVIANPSLPPVFANITNTHSDTLVVLLADRRNPSSLKKLKIAAGKSERIQMDRDPGATIVETFETMDGFGNWQQQQFSTTIPANVLYDISVYEEFLQSIAIDRTGTSPNPIEDVNYQPRSIGFFLVPPGDALSEESEIDAYQIAMSAQNPGSVRRLSQRDLELGNKGPANDPLKDLLKQFRKQRGSF